MNYISEINKFYDWLETNRLPKSAIALWYALMHVNNKADWVESFAVAISALEFKTGFKRSELFEARNILAQKNRITWESRGGNMSAVYKMIPFCIHNKDTSADTSADTNPTQTGTINKQNKTKRNKTKQEKEISSNEDTKKVEISLPSIFEEFRKKYPGDKRGSDVEFDYFKKTEKKWQDVIPLLIPSLEREIKHRELLKKNKKFCADWKRLRTWIFQKCWTQEFGQIEESTGTSTSAEDRTMKFINQFKNK